MRARRITSLAAAVFLTASFDLFAQQDLPVTPGDRVRVVWLGTDPLVATVQALNADTMVLDVEGQAAPLAMPLAVVRKLEVRRGQKSNAGKGALVGTLMGATFGSLVGALAWTTTEEEDCSFFSSEPCNVNWGPEAVPFFAGVFGGLGAGVGLLIGAAKHGDRWVEVPLEQFRVAMSPVGRRGFALSVSVFVAP